MANLILMIFNLMHFLKTKSDSPGRQDIFNRYSSLVEPIDNITRIRDLKPFKEFVSKIDTFPIAVAKEIKDKFDWEILQQLIVASPSSKADLKWNKSFELPDLLITPTDPGSPDKAVSLHKPISEMRSSEVHHLFEIYIEEILEKEIHKAEHKNESEAIENERSLRIVKSQELKLIADKLTILSSLLEGFDGKVSLNKFQTKN